MWTVGVFTVGKDVAERDYLEQLYTVEKANRENYEQQLERYEENQSRLQAQVAEYMAKADALHSSANDLRMQLTAAERRNAALQELAHKSSVATRDSSGRLATVGEVLRKCTAFVEERDQIALYYNELREQCKLK